ncbi:hypothetical protein GCM10025298_20850 [Natronobiforma cellulositropha]
MIRRPRSLSHQLWITMFALSAAMLALLGWSFLYLDPGTPSYVIAQFTAIVLVAMVVGTGVALFSGWTPF